MPWTKLAEPYPRKLNHILAHAVAEALKPSHERRLIDAAAMCRCSSRRIGEASNPGPSSAVASLDDVPLVSART